MIPYSYIFIATLIGVVPVFAWLWFLNRNEEFGDRSSSFLVQVFFVGILTAIPASLMEIAWLEFGGEDFLAYSISQVTSGFDGQAIFPGIMSLFLVAVVEELSKIIGMAVVLLRNRRKSPDDGLVLGALVGLAFGVAENGIYFAPMIGSDGLGQLFILAALRFVVSTSAHIVYSSIAGYFLLRAFQERGLKSRLSSLVKAIAIPVAIHALFNFLISSDFAMLVVVIVFGGFLFVWNKRKILLTSNVSIR